MTYKHKEPPRICGACGRKFCIKPTGESRSRFRRRKYCSNQYHIKRLGPVLKGKPKGSVIMEHLNPLPAETVMVLEFITGNPNIGNVFAKTDFARMEYKHLLT